VARTRTRTSPAPSPPGTTWTAQVTKVEFNQALPVATAASGAQTVGWTPSCSLGSDPGLQRLTIQVDSGSGNHSARETVVVIKRQASCNYNSSTYQNSDQGPC